MLWRSRSVLIAKSVTDPKRVMLSLQALEIADVGAHDHGLSKIRRHGGDLNDIAAAKHVGDDCRTAEAGNIGGAGQHRLNDHCGGADVHHVDVEAVFLEYACLFCDHPGEAVESQWPVRECHFG